MVERYSLKEYKHGVCEDPKGDWVRYSDYAALSAELEAAKHQLIAANALAEVRGKLLKETEFALSPKDAEPVAANPVLCVHKFGIDARRCLKCGWDFRRGDPPDPAPEPAGLEKAVEAMLRTNITPFSRLTDYLDFDASDAVALGVILTSIDASGRPQFHGNTDIRADEYDDFASAILKPLLRAALPHLSPSPQAVGSTDGGRDGE